MDDHASESVILRTLLSQKASPEIEAVYQEDLIVSEKLAEAAVSDIAESEDDNEATFRVPKYFQALLSLFVCFIVLFCTLGIIRQAKKLLEKCSCGKTQSKIPLIKVDENRFKKCAATNERPSSVLQRNNSETYYEKANSPGSGSCSPTEEETFQLPPPSIEKTKSMKAKKIQFVRRGSGQFGDEALDFVGETYKKKCKEKLQPEIQGKVIGKIKTQQSIRKQNKANREIQ